MFFFPRTTWTRLFLAVAIVQSLSALSLEACVFVIVEDDLDPRAFQVASGHTVPMYFSLFIFAFIYELFIVYDALRLNSMIQVVGLCIYNTLILIYAAVQPLHVKKALNTLSTSFSSGLYSLLPPELNTWQRISPVLVTVLVVQAVATTTLIFVAYKLHFEFAWVVYKVLHADLSMKRRLLTFQIYVALVKFDFFFFLGFLVQIVTLFIDRTDPEYGLSIAGIFVALAVMCLAIYCAKIESKLGTLAIIAAYIGAAVYLGYKLSVLHTEDNLLLIIFAAITLVMVLCTIVVAILCMANFDKGLKDFEIPHPNAPQMDTDLESAQDYSFRPPIRMELD
ncbi:hypothetical protein VTL71DRAFT_4432 [Oculimacula yallundae]|uniref:Uncharacterized protein n=1 Tax=Oculimacula yallundae TaxID=86028 RepID=A0ABR4C4D4_9HELO